jgi:hypothetical protein
MSISFGKISPLLTIPLTYALATQARMYIFSSNLVPKNNSPFNSTFISSFAMITIGILEIISQYRQKHEKEEKDLPSKLIPEFQDDDMSSSEKASHEGKTYSEEHTSKGFLTYLPFMAESSGKQSSHTISSVEFSIIFLIALTNFAVNFIVFDISAPLKIDELNLDMEITFIGFLYVCILCSKILKQEFHKHHKVSLIIILICECILAILTFIVYFFNKERQSFLKFGAFILWLLFCDIYFSTKHTTEKWLMDKRYISPFLLMFIEGVFSLLINILAMVILSFVPCYQDKETSYCYKQNVFELEKLKDLFIKNYIFVILFYISSIVVELCMTLTNKIYSPTYRPTFDCLFSFVPLLYHFYSEDHSMMLTYFVFLAKVVLYIVIIFCCMMFNEIVVVNIYGLNKDLKEEIKKRAIKEYDIDKSNLGHYINEEQKVKENENENMSLSISEDEVVIERNDVKENNNDTENEENENDDKLFM